MLTLLQFPSTRSSLTTSPVKKELPQRVRPNLWPLAVLAAMAVLVSVSPVHADTVPLSTLIANPSAEITGPGGLVYSHFTYSSPFPSSSFPLNDISVATDSVSATQSRIQFGLFTTSAGQGFRDAAITYQVASTIGPITDFHLVTPPGVTGGLLGRAFADAGYFVTADITEVGFTFISQGQSFPGADHALLQAPTFPSGLATLAMTHDIQMFPPDSTVNGIPTNAFLTLPHFDDVYTVTVVPEASTWLLMASGLIALMMRWVPHCPRP